MSIKTWRENRLTDENPKETGERMVAKLCSIFLYASHIFYGVELEIYSIYVLQLLPVLVKHMDSRRICRKKCIFSKFPGVQVYNPTIQPL